MFHLSIKFLNLLTFYYKFCHPSFQDDVDDEEEGGDSDETTSVLSTPTTPDSVFPSIPSTPTTAQYPTTAAASRVSEGFSPTGLTEDIQNSEYPAGSQPVRVKSLPPSITTPTCQPLSISLPPNPMYISGAALAAKSLNKSECKANLQATSSSESTSSSANNSPGSQVVQHRTSARKCRPISTGSIQKPSGMLLTKVNSEYV